MKLWKTILLQTGIFTAVFALGAGTGFLVTYKKVEHKEPVTRIVAQEPEPVEQIVETPADKFLNNLVNSKALEGDVNLTIKTGSETIEEGNEELPTRALSLNELSDVDLSLENVQISIANLEDIKLSADVNVKTGPLDMSFTLGYFDGAIYLDYEENHFYLKTSDIGDVMNMLPSTGASVALPDELTNIDFDALTTSLTTMQEVTEGDKHYFAFNFSEDIQIRLLSNESYELVGVELPEISFMGMTLSAESTLHTLKEDIADLVKPTEQEGAKEYKEFKPAFTLVNNVMSLVNKKKTRISYDLDVNKKDNLAYNDFFEIVGDLDFDFEELALFTSFNVYENNRVHPMSAGYQNDTAFISSRNLNLSIEKQSILGLVDYISSKISSEPETRGVLDQLGDVTNELTLAKILKIINDLPVFVQNFELTSNKLSFDFDPSYFELPVSTFNFEINFDEEAIKSIKLSGLTYGDFVVNATLELKPYVEVSINPDNYVRIDPALSLIDSVEKLINQDKFGISFSITTDDQDASTEHDISFSGNFQFAIKNNAIESDEDNKLPSANEVLNKKAFDYGAGRLTIVDGDLYEHRIKADALSEGKVLLEYNDKIHAKFDNETVESITALATKLFNEKDEHFMELFGSMLEQTGTMPLNDIMDGQYGLLLDTEIISYLNITDTKISVGINGAIIGADDMCLDVVIRYSEAGLEGVDISNINLGGRIINISANIHDFDEGLYQACRLDENAYSYIDLSTISVLLQLGLNTSEFNYYHFVGTVDIQIPINLVLVQTEIKKTIDVDAKILNDKGHVKVYVKFSNIPIIAVASAGVMSNYDSRTSY